MSLQQNESSLGNCYFLQAEGTGSMPFASNRRARLHRGLYEGRCLELKYVINMYLVLVYKLSFMWQQICISTNY